MQGGNVNDGLQWHNYMIQKCYAPYTDFYQCKLDQREAGIAKLRATMGEEQWNKQEMESKAYLEEKFGKEKADKIWDYKKDYNSRFRELRKAADEEMGVIRNGMSVPEIAEKGVSAAAAPVKEVPPVSPEATTWKTPFKGWWSEPESRFKKG